ncbi:hypothetical protein FRC05_000956 [Tulasnella sp. 425]|nr:hypothetical protein FRC05_000956 [Tulasnella sp. 425]
MSEPIVTTGAAPGLQPSVAPRIESHDFVKNERLFSLYVQALQRFYDSQENKADSHFQIGGIHGLPYVRWDNAGPEKPVGVPAGYCQHSTVIFPTWHRPYCALYEQILNKHAVEIAGTYTTNREEWQKAAADLRLPFWDWALHALPPKQFYDHRQYSEVTITLPDGSKKPVKNPMLSYRFHSGHGPAPPNHDNPTYNVLSTLPATLRHPTRPVGPNSTSDIASFESVLTREFEDTRPDTATLLLEVTDWFGFSTQAAASGAWTRSLEAIHNTLHVKIGFSGHMNYVPYAAFDPIFWMHHCNVDRVVALWQYINYNTWVSPRNDAGSTWVTKPGSLADENTQLAPFRIDQNSFWTSTQCRAPMTLRYTYPDFQGLDMNDLPAVSTAITQRVTQLYYDKDTFAAFPGLVPTMAAAKIAEAQAPLGIAAASVPLTGAVESVAAAAASLGASGSSRRTPESIEWTVRVRCKQADLRHVASILIFIDGVPDDQYGFMNDKRYAGSFDPFVNPFPKLCQNCVDGDGIVIEGFVHITYSLIKRGLNVLDARAVEEYLHKNLKWVPRMHNGEYGRVEDLKSLEVTVIDTPLVGGEGVDIPAIGAILPEGSDDPRGSPHYVGSWDTFFDDLAQDSLNPGDKTPTVIQSFVNLTRAMTKRLGSDGLQPAVAEPFLKENLSCHQQIDNQRIDLNEVPSLEVVVLAIPMTDSGNGPPRKSGPPVEYPDITEGKEGGYRSHEDNEAGV